MEPVEVAHAYFAAWNARDPAAIVAAFAEGGCYTDPLAGTLSGPAIGEYAGSLFAAFPDLSFDIVSAAPVGDGAVAAQWLMKGVNTAPFRGLPPTNRAIAVPGADFITVAGDKVQTVVGYFDSAATPRQLGLQVIVQPHQVGPFAFGSSTKVHSGRTDRPGAFSLTVLTARSPEEAEEIRGYSRQIARELLAMPGFISWLGVTVGDRMVTITAWERPEDARQLMRGGEHKEAMDRFFSPTGVAVGGSTSVWQPHHLNPLWMRCAQCGRMVVAKGDAPRCECGADLPRDFPYW